MSLSCNDPLTFDQNHMHALRWYWPGSLELISSAYQSWYNVFLSQQNSIGRLISHKKPSVDQLSLSWRPMNYCWIMIENHIIITITIYIGKLSSSSDDPQRNGDSNLQFCPHVTFINSNNNIPSSPGKFIPQFQCQCRFNFKYWPWQQFSLLPEFDPSQDVF